MPVAEGLLDWVLSPIRGIGERIEQAVRVIWWQGFWTGFLAGLAGAILFLLVLAVIARRQ